MKYYLNPLRAGEQSLLNTQPKQASQPELADSVWVRLIVLPNPFSHDEGMLLCRHSDDEWVVWIPDHGEVILHVSEFYFEADWN